jgi:hypothetical protein
MKKVFLVLFFQKKNCLPSRSQHPATTGAIGPSGMAKTELTTPALARKKKPDRKSRPGPNSTPQAYFFIKCSDIIVPSGIFWSSIV